MIKKLKESLKVNLKSSNETWEVVKEESKKGNVEARIALAAYYVETIFNPQAESLDELIERLIGKDIENILRQM